MQIFQSFLHLGSGWLVRNSSLTRLAIVPREYLSRFTVVLDMNRNVDTSTTPQADKPIQEWDANRYQNQHSFVWEFGSSLIDLIQPLEPGSSILDLGCGTGELTDQLHQSDSSLRVMGLDADPSMIQRAQEQFPDVSFEVGDMRNFSVPEPVDVLFSNAALHWIPPADVDRAVACMAAALKPGGKLVVEFGGSGNVEAIVSALEKVMQKELNPWYFPSIANFASVLEKHSIEVTSASLFDRPTVLKDGTEGLNNWMRMFGKKFLEKRSEQDVDKIFAAVNTMLRDKLFDGSEWTADYRRIRVIGRKMDVENQ